MSSDKIFYAVVSESIQLVSLQDYIPNYFIRRNFRESKNSRIFLDKLSRFDKSKKFREINFREWRNWKDFAR